MEQFQTQIQRDFGSWGSIFSTSTLLKEDPSPFKRILEQGFSKDNSRLVFSVCPDDINRVFERETVENLLKNTFGAEFHLGNLAAYPIGGVTGITAASHHIPGANGSKSGNLIFFINPHVGLVINEEVRYGVIQRPGQDKYTNSCGAMMEFLKSLRHVETIKDIEDIKDDLNDPSKILLFKELLDNYKEEILEKFHSQDLNQTIIKLTKINYELVMEKFKSMLTVFLEKGEFEGQYVVIGGITVNTKEKDYFIFRDYTFNSARLNYHA